MTDNLTRTRFKATIAVYAAILNETGQVLLQKRANTGYMDGFYDFPSGHLEAGETLSAGAAREVLEEVCLKIKSENLELLHVNQNNVEEDMPYVNFLFQAKAWSGRPQIGEPEKCSDLDFFELNNLPKVTPLVREALKHLNEKSVTFSYFTPKNFNP